ncbi:MAG TPA: glycosyltransferase [Pyrinomonadaceae bacterium]|nr:glycosyltransferase [Pyrinomonadaceae bacterium]
MSYRFQKLTTIYPEYLQRFLSDHPDATQLPYEELYDRYVGTHFGWADYYPRHLKALGNEAQEVFTSFEALQKAWAEEHGVRYDQRNWFKQILFAQVRAFQPDVLFLEDLYRFDSDFRKQLREVCAKRPLIIGYRGAPTEDYGSLKDVDVLLTCAPHFVEYMRQAGANAALLPHAFEPAILDAVGHVTRDLDLTFVGNLVMQDGFHMQRYALIEKLLESTSLQVWTSISQPESGSRSKRVLLKLASRAKKTLKDAGLDSGFIKSSGGGLKAAMTRNSRTSDPSGAWKEKGYAAKLHEPVFGLANFRILARSRLTLNNHIDCAEDYAGNSRLYEATGMGACLITDWKRNLSEMFEPDSEVVTYKCAEECSEKINYLLAHESERQAIAQAGQQRTLSCHTFKRRSAQLDELIREAIT